MNVKPEIKEKKKIVKKVRFYDDDPIENNDDEDDEPLPRVGTKRCLTRNDKAFEDDINQENSQAFNEEAAAQAVEKDIIELEKKDMKRQKISETQEHSV